MDVVQLLHMTGRSTALSRTDAKRHFQRWCETFLDSVRQSTGSFRYRGMHWHAFSFGLVNAREKKVAFDLYNREEPVPLIIIPEQWEKGRLGWRFVGGKNPDLTDAKLDLYVFPESAHWTMVFTHEQPGTGPFFVCNK